MQDDLHVYINSVYVVRRPAERAQADSLLRHSALRHALGAVANTWDPRITQIENRLNDASRDGPLAPPAARFLRRPTTRGGPTEQKHAG